MNVTSVYVEITNQCNLNCRTCYNRSGLNRTREELSCEDLEQLIQLFLPLGLKHLSLSGGEPTLHSAFDKVLGLTERYPQLQFSLTTNGTTNSRPSDRPHGGGVQPSPSNQPGRFLRGSQRQNARGQETFPGLWI